MFEELTEKILECIRPGIAELNLELVELILRRQGRVLVITILMDKVQGGITIDECVAINKRLNRTMEEEQWISGEYLVEVASTGLDRSLKTSQDFLRVVGKRVRFHLSEIVERKCEHVGVVAEVNSNSVLIKAGLKIITIPLTKINKAVQDI